MQNTSATNIGATIARARHAEGLTQEQLADLLGVTKAAVSKWELGLSLPDVALLPSIAAQFGMSLDELFDWDSQLDEGQVRETAARIALRANDDPEGAYAEIRSVTAEHPFCLPWLLQAAMFYLGRSAADPTRADELKDNAFDCLDRVEARSEDARQLALARFIRAGFLRRQDDRLGEAIALLEGIVGATPIGTSSVLASLYEQCGRAEDAASLRERELFSSLGGVMGGICAQLLAHPSKAQADALLKAGNALVSGFELEEHLPETALTFWAGAAAASAQLEEATEAASYLARFAGLAEKVICAAEQGERFPAGPLFEHVFAPGNAADMVRPPASMVRKGLLSMVEGRGEWSLVAQDSKVARALARIRQL